MAAPPPPPPPKTTTTTGPHNRIPVTDLIKIFTKFDRNNDGKISGTELHSILSSLGTVPSDDEVRSMMSIMDSDGDGFIDLSEFVEFHLKSSVGGEESEEEGIKELREAFEMYDKDKNGRISARELLEVMKGLGEKCSLKDCKRMISRVDVDGDGCVDFDEFKNMMSASS